jgi:hypothetical protein
MNKKLHKYLYDVENWLDEVVIAVLSFGAIFVVTYQFYTLDGMSFGSIGRTIFPWITMLALMIIGRELWLIKNAVYRKWELDGE